LTSLILTLVRFTQVTWHVGVGAADARTSVLPPIDTSDPNRCLPTALDKFASTRAAFSLEAGSGDNADLLVDIRCATHPSSGTCC